MSTTPGSPGLPAFIQFGRNHEANTDGYVYIYFIRVEDPSRWDVQAPGVMWLARAPAAGEAFTDRSTWEWVVDLDASHNPTWGDEASRVPVLEDPDGFMRSSAMYNPGLDRYLLVTNHTARNHGNIAIWEAPKPWGPWNVVLKESGWPGSDPSAPPESELSRTFAFGNFSPKWLSADGRQCVFVWFRPDRWNSVACRFLVAGDRADR